MEENKEKLVEEIVDETVQQKEETQEQPKEEIPKIDLSKFQSKDDPTIHKVDLSKPIKPEENEVKEDNINEGGITENVQSEDSGTTQKQEEIQPEVKAQEAPVVEEVTEEQKTEIEQTAEIVEEAVAQNEATGKPIPDGVMKLIQFMEDTGGDVTDYVRLNEDFSSYGDKDLLTQYYYKTKPHLSVDEINFLMEDKFAFDEEVDDEKEVKRKKLALKEQVADARTHLEELKSRYYEDIKAGSKLTSEQQKAVNFFNRYNENVKQTQKQSEVLRNKFTQKTEEVFNKDFKGFEYKIGDKRFRYNVNNTDEVKMKQTDINDFARKFLGEDGSMQDSVGYHKSLFTAMNADAIANHFYEQGKADALKNSVATSKNIDMNPRQSHGAGHKSGPQFKVLGDDTASFKFKIKNKNK